MMAEDECQFLISQTLVCLHLVLSADLCEVHEKTNSQEVRYQLSMIAFYHVYRFFIFKEGDCFRFDRSRIDCCRLIMSLEPEGP